MKLSLPHYIALPTLVIILVITLSGCEVISAPAPDIDSAGVPATAVVTLAPTPESTLPSAVLLQRALAARSNGDDAAVGADLSALLDAHPDAPEVTQARYYLAESFARRGNWASAATLFTPLADAAGAFQAPALFWLARAHEASGDHAAAATMFGRYSALQTPIAAYAALRQAAQLEAAGDSAAAIEAYLAAARSEIVRGERAGAFEKAIALMRQSGRSAEAIQLYVDLLDLADNPDYRARILSEAAGLAGELGQTEQASSWLREITTVAPETAQAAAAADQLLAAGDPGLSLATAGEIFFAAGRWADAISRLDAAIAQATDINQAIELRRLRGLALRAQDDFPNALAALSEAGAIGPDSEPGRQAQLDWIQTLGQSGATEQAIQGYQEYATAYPDDKRAPVALSRAAELRERLGDGEGALTIRLDLGRRYPQSSAGQSALHQAGLFLFGVGRLVEARSAWQTLAENNTGYEHARGSYWAGRAAQAGGDNAAANELFSNAHEAAPESYYSARAAEALGGISQGSEQIGAVLSDADWETLRTWVGSWAGPSDAAANLADEVGQTGFVSRANLLAEVGLQREAIAEWRAAINAWSDDPLRLAELARVAHLSGVPSAALLAANKLTELVPETAATAPTVMRRLLYPTPYAALITKEAANQNLDPRLLYALLRQESLFDPGATSWVGARGLAQVMPETGAGIAANLGLSDYSEDDLYRPVVSVRFGAYYLGTRIEDMEGSVQGALAAYNGGLGNAQRWAGGSQVADPDLFSETIDYVETAGYVKAVYGFWAAYQALYAAP